MSHDDAVSTKKAIDPADPAAALGVTPGAVDPTSRRSDDTRGCTGATATGKQVRAELSDALADPRERRFAEGASSARERSVSLVLRGTAPQWPATDVEVQEQRERLLAGQG